MLIVTLFLSYQFPVFAVDIPKMITVGLESVYKDVDKVELKSAIPMTVGYLSGSEFVEQGTLPSNNISVMRTGENYYAYGTTYLSLSEARAANQGKNGIVAYIEPNCYKIYTQLQDTNTVQVGANKSRIVVKDQNGSVILISENNMQPLMFQGADSAYSFPVTGVGSSKKYRGAIGVVNGQNRGLTAINTVSMEEYLYGVVPAEMVATWPLEALKAQAVAARSLAAYQYNRHIQKGYNVVDTTSTQVYSGVTREHPNTNRAVDETRGEVAVYNDKLAETVYFSTSGGYTEDAKNVWGSEVPYLRAVGDIYENNPEIGPWSRTITLAELDVCLQKQNVNIGHATGIEIMSRTASGRVDKLKIIGSNGEHVISNENTRTFFNGTSGGSLRSRMYGFSPTINSPAITNDQTIYILSKDNNIAKDISKVQVLGASGTTNTKQNLILQTATGTTEKTFDNTLNTNEEKTVVYGDFTIYGKGFGHGVGMSQSGAMGMAKAGYNYEEILEYYYQGIQIER